MFNLISKFFDSNEKEVKRLRIIVDEINSLEDEVSKLKDKDFALKTLEFKERIKKGESLFEIMPMAFAVVREAAKRSIGQRHFDVQLMASIVLAEGKIAEQKTGEGKTLSAVPALYLHALTGNNVHLVTVNDYLARRDAGWMGPVFNLLGMKTASIINERSFIFDPLFKDPNVSDLRLLHLKEVNRKEAYEADVVYGINSEFGFDYLRDNMAVDKNQMVQRGYSYAVVDEVDSVLIDEARTPHIISAPKEEATEKYYKYAKVVEVLDAESDYKIDEKLRTAHLTDAGIEKIEKMFGISQIYEKDFETVYHLEAALKAKTLFKKEKDYIVRDNEVILVDEFTGRLMIGRRLSEGLHQAIEAKENVPIQNESKTFATVSLQNYFRMYKKLAGMTGTAVTEAEEFNKIYKLDVVVIPTHRITSRKDLADVIYKTQKAKLTAVVDEIDKIHKTGQPILVGTTSIENNEILSEMLSRKKIKHEILNAKNHEREAEIISKAGLKNAVTVATNMAGRGVDIILGGEPPKSDNGASNEKSLDYKKWQKMHDEVLKLGGLYIIGTERHESRRIDNQLRGRAGRQGDPGTSIFFVSLDDEIMRLFGGDTISSLMSKFNIPDNVPLSHGLVSRAIEQAQIKVEGFNFDNRKHLVEYDDVLNRQREIIYEKRKKIIFIDEKEKEELRNETLNKVLSSIENSIAIQGSVHEDNLNEKIVENFLTVIPFDESSQKQLLQQLMQYDSLSQKSEFVKNLCADIYNKREKEIGSENLFQIEKFVNLSVIDSLWVDHLDTIEALRQGIGLRGYGQRDPLVEYKNEAYKLFERLVYSIDDEIVHRIFRINIEVAPTPMPIMENTPISEISGSSVSKNESKNNNSNKKLGRNDPCWCGSGKKFKKCHGA